MVLKLKKHMNKTKFQFHERNFQTTLRTFNLLYEWYIFSNYFCSSVKLLLWLKKKEETSTQLFLALWVDVDNSLIKLLPLG